MRRVTLLAAILIVALSAVGLPAGSVAQGGVLSGKTICLDPGHGGSDPGAVNGALHEADINLDVAYGLQALLKTDGAVVVMTRTDDSSKSNYDRYTFCNKEQATILVSIHTNSVSDPTRDGSLALYFKKVDVPLAQAIYDVMWPYLRDRAPSPANFTGFGLTNYASGVLLKSDMPAAMMEPLFMSNLDEAQLLQQPIYDDAEGSTLSKGCVDFNCRRGQIAQAIYNGILNYFAQSGDGGGGSACGSPPCRKGK